MNKRPAPTVRSVAALLRVSSATVSRALSRPDLVGEKTRKRVLAGIERLGYRPNLIARDLSKGETRTVLVVVPRLGPFFIEVFRGAEQAANELGFTLLMGNAQGNPAREQAFFDQVASRRADGIILLTGSLPAKLAADRDLLPPLVLAAEHLGNSTLPTVRIDHVGGAEEAVRHLIHLGHKCIAHITGLDRVISSRERIDGYRKALRAARIPIDESLIQPGDFTRISGEKAVQELLRQKRLPTAIFASNDTMAIGAIRALRQLRLKVPEDVSVVGFDDQESASLHDPPLTTVHIPRLDVGYRAMMMLHEQIAHNVSPTSVTLPTHLVIRETSAAVRR
jgi:LacI family repressor for deo operon, udp, cdd, tsx, nupC, and nupG